jgi:hypothetical protein
MFQQWSSSVNVKLTRIQEPQISSLQEHHEFFGFHIYDPFD